MVKELHSGNFNVPYFPEVGCCDVWIVSIPYGKSLKDAAVEDLVQIEHVTRWSHEGDGCSKYGIARDKSIDIGISSGDVMFGELNIHDYAYFADNWDNQIMASDNLDELKEYIEDMDITKEIQRDSV